MATASDFTGRGWAFPLRLDSAGSFVLSGGEQEIEEAIRLILGTCYGERPQRPEYGCGIHDLVFAPSAPQSVGQIVDQLRRALVAQEPRIDVLNVTGQIPAGEANLLLLRIEYRIRENNALANMVYPFFITEGS